MLGVPDGAKLGVTDGVEVGENVGKFVGEEDFNPTRIEVIRPNMSP